MTNTMIILFFSLIALIGLVLTVRAIRRPMRRRDRAMLDENIAAYRHRDDL
jgi:hypothetical protein